MVNSRERLMVEYFRRNQEFRHTDGRRFLQIEQMPVSIAELSRLQIFALQTAHQLPEDAAYRLIQTYESRERTPDGRSILSSFPQRVQLLNGRQPDYIDLQPISLENHGRYLQNKLLLSLQNQEALDWNSLGLIDLALIDAIETTPTKRDVTFTDEPERTWTFTPQPKPRTTAHICWQAAFSKPILPALIDRRVLSAFRDRALREHSCEIGAQLGGRLCQSGGEKYLHISGIAFFADSGSETQLAMPAGEIIRTARDLQNQGLTVCGYVHSHCLAEAGLNCSAIDIRNQYDKYTLPYQVMLIADTVTLGHDTTVLQCRHCLYRDNCRNAENLENGWSLYGWTISGGLTPVSAAVCENTDSYDT